MDQFTKELLKAMDEAETLGCRMVRFRQTVEKYGGVETAKEMLRKHRTSDCFSQLADQNRLDLTMEALVVKGKFGTLFTDEEVNCCFETLCDAGYYLWKR